MEKVDRNIKGGGFFFSVIVQGSYGVLLFASSPPLTSDLCSAPPSELQPAHTLASSHCSPTLVRSPVPAHRYLARS